MADGTRIISIAVREPPRGMFPPGADRDAAAPDHLTFDLAEASRSSVSFSGRCPGPGMRLTTQSMSFPISEDDDHGDVRDADERRIGDSTLVTDSCAVERLWEVAAPLLDDPRGAPCARGSWGPAAAMARDVSPPRGWRLPFRRRLRGPH